MIEFARPRLIGLNHLALEVGDIDEALSFYNRLFKFELRGKSDSMAFIDLGDQFIALQKGRKQSADDGRHFGLVVEDKEAARRALEGRRGSPCLTARSSTFATPGAIAWRSSVTTTFSSAKRPMCSVAWV